MASVPPEGPLHCGFLTDFCYNAVMEMQRLFIAIDLPDDLRTSLSAVQRQLQKKLAAFPLRWSPIENLHLTLKFLGDTDPHRIDAIVRDLRWAASRHHAFSLPVGGLGVFPDAKRPRVLWIGIRDDERRLQQLAADVDRALAKSGWPREKRPFSGHLTLARVKKIAGNSERRALGERLAALRGYEKLGVLPVAAFHLIRSQLRPDGAVYTDLARIPLLLRK